MTVTVSCRLSNSEKCEHYLDSQKPPRIVRQMLRYLGGELLNCFLIHANYLPQANIGRHLGCMMSI
jgi:hypothetical protein